MRTWNSDTGGLFYNNLFEETSLRTFDEVLITIQQYICDVPLCIETGTAYGFPPGEPYWNTTSSITKRMCQEKGGHLWSIDIEDRSENLKKLFALGSLDYSLISHRVGDSREILKTLDIDNISLLCLDSGEDPYLLEEEFKTISWALAERHYVLVDDIHNTNSVKYKRIVPYLKTLGYNWMQVPTETGLFVASKGYELPKRNLCK